MKVFPTRGSVLFSNYISNRERAAYQGVTEFDADELLNKSIDDLADIIFVHNRVDVPKLLRDHEFMDEPTETFRDMIDYGREISVPGMEYQLTIPFTGEPELFYLSPSSSNSMPPTGTIILRKLIVRVAGAGLDGAETGRLLEKIISDVELYLTWQRADATPFNARIRDAVRNRIEERRKTLLESRGVAASLGYKMRPQLSQPSTHRAPQVVRRSPPAGRATPPRPFVSEPELSRKTTNIFSESSKRWLTRWSAVLDRLQPLEKRICVSIYWCL
jgi:hypothetical protein